MLVSADWKDNSYGSLLATAIDSRRWYKPVYTIDAADFAEVILDVVVRHHGLPGSVVIGSVALYPLETCHCCATFTAFHLQNQRPYRKAK